MTAAPVRVVFLSHAFMVGGAEEMVYNLVRYLPDRFQPHVCCIQEAGPIGEEIRRTGVPFAVLGLNPGLRRPWDVIRIKQYLRETQPTIVHTFLLTASLYGRVSALLAGVPIVIGTEGESRALVEKAGCGVAVEPENPTALATAIRRLYESPAHASDLGRRGREFVLSNNDRAVLAAKYADALKSLCAKPEKVKS